MTSKGQITIPKALREHLRVKPGDRVKFFTHPDGSVVLLPVRPVAELRNILRPWARPSAPTGRVPARGLSIESMRAAGAEAAMGGRRRSGNRTAH